MTVVTPGALVTVAAGVVGRGVTAVVAGCPGVVVV